MRTILSTSNHRWTLKESKPWLTFSGRSSSMTMSGHVSRPMAVDPRHQALFLQRPLKETVRHAELPLMFGVLQYRSPVDCARSAGNRPWRFNRVWRVLRRMTPSPFNNPWPPIMLTVRSLMGFDSV